jgi:hypothetical protein
MRRDLLHFSQSGLAVHTSSIARVGTPLGQLNPRVEFKRISWKTS